MFDLEACVKIIIEPEFEGTKFSRITGDLGGDTRYGITQRNYDTFRANRNLDKQSVELISIDEVTKIYEVYFFNKCRCDEMVSLGKDKLALVVFNCDVQRGESHAISMLQEILGIDMQHITGFCGPITLGFIKDCDEQNVITKYLQMLVKHYNDEATKPDQAKFLGDWLRRTNALAKIVGVTLV